MVEPAIAATATRRSTRLFTQIALRLAVVTVLFMLLEIAIVVAMYSRDPDTLGADLISIEAQRIARLVDGHEGTLSRAPLFADGAPRAVAVFDAQGGLLLRENPGHLPLPETALADLHSQTAREQRGEQFFISGVRRVEHGGQTLWVTLGITGQGFAPMVPALVKEVIDHALLPLIPLSLLLLVFNIAAVRRMLAPLERAMADAEALDPSAMERRLHLPESPVEVRSLLGAVNRALDRLEHTMRTLRQFTADAAHELRTPLAVMTLSIDRLPPSGDKLKLQEDAVAMSRLIGQMLDLARTDAMDDVGSSRADLHELASVLAADMAPLAIRSGKSLSYRNEGSPAVRGRAELLERALRNLIENALTHTAPGTSVAVTVGPGPSMSVRDHGPGIPADQREKIFDRFWRADRRYSGAGLGLAITRSTVEACGGRVDLADAHGGGTLAKIQLIEATQSDPLA